MNSKFLQATASYFGLADTHASQAEVHTTEQGAMVATFQIQLTDEDMVGILGHMKAMAEPMPTEPIYVQTEAPSDERMRDEYNAMDKRTKSEFGSFARYKTWRLGGGAELVDKVEIPPHVWIEPGDANLMQRVMAVGRDERGRYAVALDDLTAEQRRRHELATQGVMFGAADIGAADTMRAGYVERTMAATDRLTGADSKPTSNADDFGGLPG